MHKNKTVKLRPVWVVRGSIGYKGLQEKGFLKEGLVAIGWNRLGDLSRFIGNEAQLRSELKNTYPEYDSNYISYSSGRISTFLSEIKANQFVVLPSHTEATVSIGRIRGDYEYKPGEFAEYNDGFDDMTEIRNIRRVKWLATIPKSEIDADVLLSLNSPKCLYKINDISSRYIINLYQKKYSDK